MLLFLSYITMAASNVATYGSVRRSTMHPVMQEQPGYGGLALLRPRTGGNTVRLSLLNWWACADDQQQWANSSAHRAMSRRTRHLVHSAESSVYECADDLSLAVGDPAAATMFSIGFHQAAAGRGAHYRSARRDFANPSIREAPGFVGISVCADPADTDRFVTLMEWADNEAADEYYASAEYVDVALPAITAVLSRLEPSERYDVLMRDTPGSGIHATG